MSYLNNKFCCLVSGTFHQGNETLFPISHNRQCTVNSACALAWMSLRKEFTSEYINEILRTGDRLYRTIRTGREIGDLIYLRADEVPRNFTILDNEIHIDDISFILWGSYPDTVNQVDFRTEELRLKLEEEVRSVDNRHSNVGYLFTGRYVTVAFWHHNGSIFLFDPHGVNENRVYDFQYPEKNIARLFQCDSYLILARLLLSNAVLDGNGTDATLQYEINRLTFKRFDAEPPIDVPLPAADLPVRFDDDDSVVLIQLDYDDQVTQHHQTIDNVDVNHNESNSFISEEIPVTKRGRPKKTPRGRPKKTLDTTPDCLLPIQFDVKLHSLFPVVQITPLNLSVNGQPQPQEEVDTLNANISTSIEITSRVRGRRKKIKHGRPKSLETTREEQGKVARINYNQTHPEVHRDATHRYDIEHSQEHSERRIRFRVNNPILTQLRHVSKPLARQIVERGPIAYWNGTFLSDIRPYKLRKPSLSAANTFKCVHCGARLYDEEKMRKKWCCGEGAYNVLTLAPLETPFYRYREFLYRARAFNDLFAFCALEVSGGYRHPRGLAFFKIEGRMYHNVYNLDAPGQRFTTLSGISQLVNRSRLYLDDGEERRNIAEGRSLDLDIIDEIKTFIFAMNPYVAHFKMLGQEPSVNARLDFQLTTTTTTTARRTGDRHTGIEVHAVLNTEGTARDPRWLSIWKLGKNSPTRISPFHALMEPFQYPLLYPEGTLGWHIGRLDNQGNKLSQYNYSRCLLLSQSRFSQFGRLSQAWQVDMFARFEEERLGFIANTQNVHGGLRVGPLNELVQATLNNHQVIQDIARDETIQGEGGPQAGKIYLPSTYTGGPRYMKVHYENAMGLVVRKGAPTFFLTFTYSAQWDEHKQACTNSDGGGPVDPSIACRIFHIKLQELIRDLRSGAFFGPAVYIVYVIEMQMRGLPHSHIVFKIDGIGPTQANEIDSVIWAVIPSENEAGGRLRELVLQHMIHGPCGKSYRRSKDFLCWDSQKGYCTKFFPKPNIATTHVDERGFVQYRRDYDNKGHVKTRYRNQTIEVHDGWVVPYNPGLLLKYEAHINLELSSTRRVIKYLFKYLMKGGSLQNVTILPLGQQSNEVEHYVTKRMVGASDACWRLLDFGISKSEPATECLPVHLEGKQMVYFKSGQMDEAISRSSSKLLIYFQRPNDAIFHNVTYPSFFENYMLHTVRPPTLTTFFEHADGKHFITARKRGEKVCRLIWIAANRGDVYYLRLLLLTIPCRGYQDLLSRGGGPQCTTFQQVARYLGLVDDEREYQEALREASVFMVGPRLRSFFVLLCNLGAPAALLWEQFRDTLCEDHLERNLHRPQLAYNRSLREIDRSLRKRGACLADFGLPHVNDRTTELDRELTTYAVDDQRAILDDWLSKLSNDQRCVFDYVRALLDNTDDNSSSSSSSRIIFVDGPGGYGKTQLLRVLLAYVRSCEKVALAVACSGIAARQLPGGSTAHSMFLIPLDLGNGDGVWNVSNSSQRGSLIRSASLIVFDEAPMTHRYIFEIIDRSLKDLMMNSNNSIAAATTTTQVFGGKIFLCSGDFRQIAPVVEKARTPSDTISVSLLNSPLWRHFKIFHLSTPQRTKNNTAYSDYLLQVGNGAVPSKLFGEGRNRELLIPLTGINYVTSLDNLIAEVFPSHILRDPNHSATRAILSPFIVNVNEVNERILNSLEGHLHELLSADSVDREADDGFDVDIQLLHQSTAKGVPDHILRLKIGSVCLIMRNLNISDGLVNGTKVIVIAISPRLITVQIPGEEQLFAIPRITFKFSMIEGSPLRILRRQFPLMLAYAMTGHKSQGQTIDFVGIDLRTDCFTHGQLYVLLSRVRSPTDLLVLVPDEHIHEGVAYVKNVVYYELLELLHNRHC